ncbi:hypothetical protein BpHYR1_017812 [Brachionus plicatilis]|uniref:Uncharacterized protein n=1 Tax=Brachionus plicatilis TaxID=10195 RepID=A0A3M7RMT7_BRAPC|nr:hypothetical protein BpHYR1_017812 [Brachionus plicatilis]
MSQKHKLECFCYTMRKIEIIKALWEILNGDIVKHVEFKMRISLIVFSFGHKELAQIPLKLDYYKSIGFFEVKLTGVSEQALIQNYPGYPNFRPFTLDFMLTIKIKKTQVLYNQPALSNLMGFFKEVKGLFFIISLIFKAQKS